MASYALLTNALLANSPPSAASDGVELRTGLAPPEGDHLIAVKSTAGSGTMTVTIKLWGYYAASSAWHPIGTHGTSSLRGVINGGAAIGEIAADTIRHCEVLPETTWGLKACDRIYAEIVSIGGAASTAISAFLVTV